MVIPGFPKGKREAVIKHGVTILHANGQTGSEAWLDHSPRKSHSLEQLESFKLRVK